MLLERPITHRHPKQPRPPLIRPESLGNKIQKVFGLRERHSLEEGLARMARWVRAHGARPSREVEGIEVQKNFPEAWLKVPEDSPFPTVEN